MDQKGRETRNSWENAPLNAQGGAKTIHDELHALLCPEDYDTSSEAKACRIAAADRLANKVGSMKHTTPSVEIRGVVLKKLICQSEGKAGGVDQWRGDYLADLPDSAYEAMAELWNAVLAGAPLPVMWTKIRVVTLPKEEGGYRGLSIASLLWRVGMTAVIGEISEWAEKWLPEELVGGIRGRSADELHERLMAAIDAANHTGDTILGGQDRPEEVLRHRRPRASPVALGEVGGSELGHASDPTLL